MGASDVLKALVFSGGELRIIAQLLVLTPQGPWPPKGQALSLFREANTSIPRVPRLHIMLNIWKRQIVELVECARSIIYWRKSVNKR